AAGVSRFGPPTPRRAAGSIPNAPRPLPGATRRIRRALSRRSPRIPSPPVPNRRASGPASRGGGPALFSPWAGALRAGGLLRGRASGFRRPGCRGGTISSAEAPEKKRNRVSRKPGTQTALTLDFAGHFDAHHDPRVIPSPPKEAGMFEQMVGTVPEQWREIAQLLMAPLIWIPRLERQLIDLFLNSSSGWTAAAKYLFLLFPLLLGIAAVWCTQLSIYTLPFRSRRIAFVSAMLMTWWEGARAVWLYW